jgi:hypothetical protein
MKDGDPPDEKPWLANAGACEQLQLLAASRKTRTVARLRNRWEPWSVRDPVSGEFFDTDTAWRFIHGLLVGGTEVEVIELDHPPGKKGYVLFGTGGAGVHIYIKLQFAGNSVVGRSFHISNEMSRIR